MVAPLLQDGDRRVAAGPTPAPGADGRTRTEAADRCGAARPQVKLPIGRLCMTLHPECTLPGVLMSTSCIV
jgi:hypothetical protein